ncbi:snapalysin [Saccharopolyspora lacisalsi]|uniref:Extracellular small neutral protease n=1 Tax=Halosaccharopolyspora lacisalsi TaxID=1000566 RepID=A0A839DTJ1_9PSEU|nr:snapalysin family zinc-dependent metalloprotease [Halosaccharopolyspora lacisalsi]MBA8825282.1 snapalysin [Halosaccharopolyspora lacisalsi]
MNPFRSRSVFAVFAIALLALVGLPVAGTAVAAPEAAPRVVTYDAGGAADFRDVVDEAARIWNSSVDNVRLEPADGSADVVVVADDGWPRARTDGLGRGKIWMGRQAVDQGHDPTRIAAHEFGHIFGLPDRRTGVCEELMSGHSAGTDCSSAHPNGEEAAEVDRNFAAGVAVPPELFVDSAPAADQQVRY